MFLNTKINIMHKNRQEKKKYETFLQQKSEDLVLLPKKDRLWPSGRGGVEILVKISFYSIKSLTSLFLWTLKMSRRRFLRPRLKRNIINLFGWGNLTLARIFNFYLFVYMSTSRDNIFFIYFSRDLTA